MVAPVSAIWAAAPWTTVKAPRVPVVSPAAVASIVDRADERAGDRLGGDAGGGGRGAGAGDGAGAGLLGEGDDGGVVGGDGVAGGVLDRRREDAGRAGGEVRRWRRVSAICAAAPWTTVKEPSVPVVRPAAVASMTTGPTSAPVIVFVATPLDAVAVPVPVTVPAPDCLAKVTTVVLSAVTVLPAASWIVAVRTRVAPEVRLAVEPLSAICVGGAVDDGEGAERAGGEAARGGFHRDRADERAGDRLRRDAGGGGCGAGAGDGAGPGLLGERDDGRVVGGDGVAVRVLDRRGRAPGSRPR